MPEIENRKNELQLQFYTDPRILAGIVQRMIELDAFEPGIKQSEFLRTLFDQVYDSLRVSRPFQTFTEAETYLSRFGLVKLSGGSVRFGRRIKNMELEENMLVGKVKQESRMMEEQLSALSILDMAEPEPEARPQREEQDATCE